VKSVGKKNISMMVDKALIRLKKIETFKVLYRTFSSKSVGYILSLA